MPRKPARLPTLAHRADRFDLYQRAVQTVDAEIDFVDETFKALRGRLPRSIREDFCGTANTSCEFVRRRRGNRAYAVDLDPVALAWGIEHNLSKLSPDARARLELIRGDVRTVRTPPVDAVLAMNFSYYVFKERATMRDYFRGVCRGLRPRGVFFLDVYGGYEAGKVLRESRPIGGGVTYVWRQAEFNPITSRTTCRIDFRFRDGSRLKDAFVYHWRLWTLPELREILAEAGFRRSTVYWEGWDEKAWEGDGDFKPTETAEPDAGWIAYLVAEK